MAACPVVFIANSTSDPITAFVSNQNQDLESNQGHKFSVFSSANFHYGINSPQQVTRYNGSLSCGAFIGPECHYNVIRDSASGNYKLLLYSPASDSRCDAVDGTWS